jgi:S1-C subfamily serine protease
VPSNLVGLLAMVEPSIVGVTVNGSSGVENGSGVIVETGPSGESYLVTDSSLFADAGPSSQVQVTTNWGHTQNASLVGTDAGSGIALLKAALPSDVSTANIGSVANIQTGEQVFSVGSLPMATNESNFAPGYINDTMSYIQPVNGASNAWYSMLVANMSVVTPDYGGAVVDSSGNVLGITNPGAPDDLSYVTPIDTIMAELSGMIKDGQAGAFPWLGVLQATDMSGPAAQSLGVEGAVQVESVASGSPVAKVGVQDNDVITTLDGRSLPSVGALIEWLANAKPGQVMSIGWLHAGRRHAGSITLGSQPTSANPS